jgi:hypothetical protein
MLKALFMCYKLSIPKQNLYFRKQHIHLIYIEVNKQVVFIIFCGRKSYNYISNLHLLRESEFIVFLTVDKFLAVRCTPMRTHYVSLAA